ncbi:Nucleolar protein 10 [Dinochytrium kinnereticum]|nr:Nucleolar protein 10 [Dinochytrium kinnereticum]
MTLSVSHQNNVKIYSITSGARSAIPDWLAKRKAKELRNDTEFRSRIELIQDFQFPEASLKIKYTPDGNHIMATGVYKPHIRVFDLAELAMKFDRHVDCENVDFVILSEDWTKSVHLNTDRTVEFHTQFGMHYRTRIPKFGRGLAYHHPSCDLFLVGSSPEIYRLNLEQGRFLNPFVTSSPEINTVNINPAHSLIAVGGEDGQLELWHPENRERLARLDVSTWMGTLGSREVGTMDTFPSITAFEFHSDGLTCAVGTQTGHVLLYDLRKPVPLLVKDHQYGLPIKKISFHPSGNVVSADSKVVRMWSKDTGKIFTAVEPPYDINDFCIQGDSGLLTIANEGVDIQTFYIPQLGPAPRWCPFLDNLTEELEENANEMSLYDDYKFVTRKELTRLGLDHLVGTNVLKAYMHGFFVDLRLYQKAKAIADPFEYDEHRRRMIEKKRQKEQGTRIHAKRVLPKINKNFAIKIMEAEEGPGEEDGKKKKKHVAALQKDDRFGAMFEDEDYQIDEFSEEWRLRHPSESKQRSTVAMENFQRMEEDDEDAAAAAAGSDDDLYVSGLRSFSAPSKSSTKKPAGPQLYELKDGVRASRKGVSSAASSTAKTLDERLKAGEGEDTDRVVQYSGGNKSVTFVPGGGGDKKGRRGDGEKREGGGERTERAKKRGVKDLGLKRLARR